MSSFTRFGFCFFLLVCFKRSISADDAVKGENTAIDLGLDCGDVSVAITIIYEQKGEFFAGLENAEKNGEFGKISETSFGSFVKLAENYNVSTRSVTEFLVDRIFHRIVISIHGKVSNVSLQILADETVSKNYAAASWGCRSEADGLKIDAINSPSGEWRLKLFGEENSKYNFNVEAFSNERRCEEKLLSPCSRLKRGSSNEESHSNSEVLVEENKLEIISKEQQQLYVLKNNDSVQNKRKIGGRSLKSHSDDAGKNERSREDNLDTSDSLMNSSIAENMLINLVEFVTMADANRNEESVQKQTSDQEEKFETRSSIAGIENLDVISAPTQEKGDKLSMRTIHAVNNRELYEEINYANENGREEKETLIELNRNSNLLVRPGTIHRIVFDAMNNCVLPVRYAFRVSSTPFRVYNVQPQYAWIYPGQMSNVAIDLIVPDNVAPNTANTVSLSVVGTEIKEKSVHLYVQGSLSKLTDDVKPSLEHYFNNNCAGKLGKDRCYKTRWSVDITIQDYDSGLKRVISSPNDIYPRTEFISGTRSPVTFYYSATCCDKSAKITAIDLLDNYKTMTVDVTEWYNLSEAEIAAITVGALFALLFIAFLVLVIAYCIRRRKSLDLPYTQRYGSRPPAQPERTDF